MQFTVNKYHKDLHRKKWNVFLETSRNRSFLYHRDYIDYLESKFQEESILILNSEDQIVCCMPCNRQSSDTIVSHSGLTYGGLILSVEIKLGTVMTLFHAMLEHFHAMGIKTIIYRDIPSVYCSTAIDDIDYCLYLSHARIIRKNTSSTITMSKRIRYSGNIRRASNKALGQGVQIIESTDFQLFWNSLLEPLLGKKFAVKPVHSVEEIMHLNRKFPANIRLFLAMNDESKPMAGVVIYQTEYVIHCQYIASSEEGRSTGALDHLLVKLIDEKFQSASYFDFGTSNTFDELEINPGLLQWKERMGGRTIAYNTYEISVEHAKNEMQAKEILW